MNNDKLSFSEAFRIKKKLMDMGIDIESVIINKSCSNRVPDDVRREFSDQNFRLFPLSSKDIVGYDILNEYIDENEDLLGAKKGELWINA